MPRRALFLKKQNKQTKHKPHRLGFIFFSPFMPLSSPPKVAQANWWLQRAQALFQKLQGWLQAQFTAPPAAHAPGLAGQLQPLCSMQMLRQAGQHKASLGRNKTTFLRGFCFPLGQVSKNTLVFLTAPLCEHPCVKTLPAWPIRLCSLIYYFQRCNPQP